MNATTVSFPTPTPTPSGPSVSPIRAAQSARLEDGGIELRVETVAGFLGAVGHDRLRWADAVRPNLCLAIDTLRDAGCRRRGDEMHHLVSIEALGLAVVEVHNCDDALVVEIWLTPEFRRWCGRKALGLTQAWGLITQRLIYVVGDDERPHPGWTWLSRLDWETVTVQPDAQAAVTHGH